MQPPAFLLEIGLEHYLFTSLVVFLCGLFTVLTRRNAIGVLMGVGWLARISDRKPSTMTPAWKAATAKYRAAQNQDPISNMS